MKKILSVILVLCMLFTSCIAMTACDLFGGSGSNETTDKGSNDTTTPATDETTKAPDGDDETTTPGGNDDETTTPGGNDDETTTPGGNDETTTPGGNDQPTVPDDKEEPTKPGDSGDNEPDGPKPSDSEAAQYLKTHAIALFNEGLGKTLASFYDVANITGALSGMEKGAVHILLENEMMREETGIGRILESFYFDMTGGQFGMIASETLASDGENVYDAFLYLDRNYVSVGGNIVFGEDNVLKLDIQNVVENFINSELKLILEEDEDTAEAVEELIAGLEIFVGAWNELLELAVYDAELNAEMLAWAESLLAYLNPVVTEESVNGEDALKITYTVSKETVGNLLEAMVTTVPDIYYEKVAALNSILNGAEITAEDMKAMMAEVYTELLAAYGEITMNFNVLTSFALAKDDGALLDISMAGNLDEEEKTEAATNGWVMDPSLNISFGSEEIVVTVAFDYTENELTTSGEFVLTTVRSEKDGVVSFRSDLDIAASTKDGESMQKADVIVLVANYNTADGAYDVAVQVKTEDYIYDEENDEYIPMEMIISAGIYGTLAVEDGKVTLSVDGVHTDEFELSDLGLSIVIDPTADMPEIPADAAEIMDLTAEELMAIFESIEYGPLWQIIDSMGNSGAEDAVFLFGEYVCNDGTFFNFDEEGYFQYYTRNHLMLEGYYYFEKDGSVLCLEYLDEDAQEWQYFYMDLVFDGMGTIILDGSVYRYVDPNTAYSFRIGTCISAQEEVFHFTPDQKFTYGYNGEILYQGTYSFGFAEFGPALICTYFDENGEVCEEALVVENYGDFVLIDGVSFIYVNEEFNGDSGYVSNGNAMARPVQMK